MQSSIISGLMFIMSALIFLTQISVEGVDLPLEAVEDVVNSVSSKEGALTGFTSFRIAIYLLLGAIFFKE